jgi:hypothetical protein
MAAKTNASPRTHWGTDAELAAYAGPKGNGDKYVTQSGVYGWDGTAWRGGTAPGSGLSNKYWVNAARQTPAVGYTTITAAVAAAVADGTPNACIMVYQGAYAESPSLPSGFSLIGIGRVNITGDVRLTGATVDAVNVIENVIVNGKIYALSGAPQPIVVFLDQVSVFATAAGAALELTTDQVTLTATDCRFTANTGTGGRGFNSDGAANSGNFTNCQFVGKGAAGNAARMKGTWTFVECDFRAGNDGAGACPAPLLGSSNPAVILRDCIFRTSGGGTAPAWFADGSAAPSWTVSGSTTFDGVATSVHGFGIGVNLTTIGPVNLGSYTVANLKTTITVGSGVPPRVWASDGCKPNERTGGAHGTGIEAYFDGGAWVTASGQINGQVVIAMGTASAAAVDARIVVGMAGQAMIDGAADDATLTFIKRVNTAPGSLTVVGNGNAAAAVTVNWTVAGPPMPVTA